MNAYGVGNILAAVAGTLPNTPYANSASIADLTGVAARRVALYGGLIMVVLAFVPKVAGPLRIVPAPAVGAYFLVLIVLLFRQGLRMVTADGLTHERGLIVCLSFWVGVGFENGQLFPELLPAWSSGLFDNGMAIGAVLALGLTYLESLRHRVRHVSLAPAAASVTRLHELLTAPVCGPGGTARPSTACNSPARKHSSTSSSGRRMPALHTRSGWRCDPAATPSSWSC